MLNQSNEIALDGFSAARTMNTNNVELPMYIHFQLHMTPILFDHISLENVN